MKLKINYFGYVAEITGCDSEIIEFNNSSASELLDVIYIKYSKLKEVTFQIAQNQIFIDESEKLSAEEIALLPPFAGG